MKLDDRITIVINNIGWILNGLISDESLPLEIITSFKVGDLRDFGATMLSGNGEDYIIEELMMTFFLEGWIQEHYRHDVSNGFNWTVFQAESK